MKATKYLILLLTFLMIGFLSDYFLDNYFYTESYIKPLQNRLDKKFAQVDNYFNILKKNNWNSKYTIPPKKGITIVAFKHDSLIYWSDNPMTFDPFTDEKDSIRRLEFISNGWYVIKPLINDSVKAYGLILIKTQYPYTNNLLTNAYAKYLNLPASTELFNAPKKDAYALNDWQGKYLFSILFKRHEVRFPTLVNFIPPMLVFIFILIFIFCVNEILQLVKQGFYKNIALLIAALVFFIIRFFQYRYHFPNDIYDLELFGPVPFGKSDWLPSLGDVFVNTVILLFLVIKFNRDFYLPENILSKQGRWKLTLSVILLISLTGFFVYTYYLLSILIIHSSISFEIYKLDSLDEYSVIGILIMAMHMVMLIIFTDRILKICKVFFRFERLLLIFIIINILLEILLYLLHFRFDMGSHLAFLLFFLIMAAIHYKTITLYNYTPMVLLVIFLSAYTVYFISYFSKQKALNTMKVMAENLSAQHDPVAEYLLEKIYPSMVKDEVLSKYLYNLNYSYEDIFNHLKRNYFNGFWNKYKMTIVDCWPGGKIEDPESGNMSECDSFYTSEIKNGSIKLGNTNFYYIDIQNGSINYLGKIIFNKPLSKERVTFYLELRSRLIVEEMGYPELLLDKKVQESKLQQQYSYAKYYKNRLLAKSGSFQYSLSLNTYQNRSQQFEGYDHIFYTINNDNVIIVSKPAVNIFDELVSFSYIFLFFYIILIIFTTVRYFSKSGIEIFFNFKNKIQFSIIAILLLSLIIVGGGTVYFSLKQYQKKHYDILSEKIQSVYTMLDRRLAYEKKLTPDWKDQTYDNLEQLLIRISDNFYTDINLYDPEGNLLASSRPEIFEQGIQGVKMDPAAFHKMVNEKQAEYIHSENIGKLGYLSAYVPFVSAENKLLAYLNLPYFTAQNLLRNDITMLIVAIVNIYVLLILFTLAAAALISGQITRPLRLIRDKFSEIELGKKNEKISYDGHDEIAGLVAEYNRMVEELALSVEMLARSERESAWREMAKQIAHEIKNPLTPMKLSVQHLQRSWKDKKENFDEYLDKVTHTLIEQIDNLSSIASEFSNFAKMPKANNEEIDLKEVIKSTLTLFANTENVEFSFDAGTQAMKVFADKEQLSRVFINLLKNAIQSIPEDRYGKVSIRLIRDESHVSVTFTDNGKGIPKELHYKMFTPSFTTKTGGMGLGLSIVKNIIESYGGTITFKTKVDVGTTFKINLPAHE